MRRTLSALLVATLLLAPLAGVGAATTAAGEGPTPRSAVGPAGGPADVSAPSAPSTPVFGTQEDCSFPVEVEDATGETVRVEDDPERVVTLGPSAAQTMWEIGAQDEVVGRTQFAAYLEGADRKENVSAPGFGNYRVERMVALETDLVLAANIISNDTVSQIRDAGLTVVRFGQATSIEDVAAKTELIGSATGNCAGATDSVRWIRQNVDAVESAVADRSPARSLYLSGTFTTGADTFLHDVLTTAGAENVAAEAGVTGFRPLNEEIVADRDPEWIVLPGAESTVPEGEPYASTTAVAEGNVLRVDPNYVAQPAPRSVVYALRNATEAFHADAYGPDQYVSRSEAAAPDPTATTSAGGDGGSGTDGTTAAGEDEDDGGDGGGQGLPGFGPVAALAALAAVLAGLGRRRSR